MIFFFLFWFLNTPDSLIMPKMAFRVTLDTMGGGPKGPKKDSRGAKIAFAITQKVLDQFWLIKYFFFFFWFLAMPDSFLMLKIVYIIIFGCNTMGVLIGGKSPLPLRAKSGSLFFEVRFYIQRIILEFSMFVLLWFNFFFFSLIDSIEILCKILSYWLIGWLQWICDDE